MTDYSDYQYLRKADLIVSDDSGSGLNLAGLTINFSIKKTDAQSPNTAAIRVYNLNQETVSRLKKEFTRITLQAGYESNYGGIFDGNIKGAVEGKENGVDTFLDIQAADGDGAYNFAVVNATLGAGATQRDQILAASKQMQALGVNDGYIADDTDGVALPRGKVMYGMSRDYIRQSAQTAQCSWSIQDGKVQVIPLSGVLPNSAIVLSSQSGLIGRPEQSDDGVKFRCLLNPMIRVGGMVQIAAKDIQLAKLEETNQEGKPKPAPPALNNDGFYRVIELSYIGQSRGTDWYCEGVGLNIDITAPPDKKVQKR